MKKTVSLLIAIVLVFTMGMAVSAEKSDFIESPSGSAAPELESVVTPDGEEVSDFFIIPFGGRNNLKPGQKEAFESSYDSIVEADEVVNLNTGLKSLASSKGISPDKLAIGDLFYAGYSDGEAGGVNTITLSSKNFRNFVALMNYANGVWSIVEDAKLDAAGKLTFTTALTGPFAVVVSKEGSTTTGGTTQGTTTGGSTTEGTTQGSTSAGATTSPATGEGFAVCAALMAVGFVAALGFKKALKA